MKKALAVIHYQPLEDYPPVQNFLQDYLIKVPQTKLRVYTSQSNRWNWKFTLKGAEINRYAMPKKEHPLPLRLLYYWLFNVRTLLALVFHRPSAILYYESTSAWPVWAYIRIFKNKVPVFIHYHEYFTIQQYSRQMWMDRYNHKLEVKDLYKYACWISHTNNERLQFFENDYNLREGKKRLQVFPNYPPAAWQKYGQEKTSQADEPVKLVYVGALSLSDTYLEEFVNWLEEQNGQARLSLFSHNMHKEAKEFLEKRNSPYIDLNLQGIPYSDLPSVLRQYDVGLILYKGITKNYEYNAPNKLFEYLACNLDVWYPREMKGIHPFKTSSTYPKVVELDFNHLKIVAINKLTTKENLNFAPGVYTAEKANEKLLTEISKLKAEA